MKDVRARLRRLWDFIAFNDEPRMRVIEWCQKPLDNGRICAFQKGHSGVHGYFIPGCLTDIITDAQVHFAPTPAHDPRKCARCHQPRHLRDKVHMLAWTHDDCAAAASAHPQPHTLYSEMEKGRI